MVQFAFLMVVALANFAIGVAAAVYLGNAPRDLGFLTPLVAAFQQFRWAADPSADEGNTTPDPSRTADVSLAVTPGHPRMSSAPAPAVQTTSAPAAPQTSITAEPRSASSRDASDVADYEPDISAPTSAASDEPPAGTDHASSQINLEDIIVDIAAQEVHLRQIGTAALETQHDAFAWEATLAGANEDIQKLLVQFNEARHLVEQQREVAAHACDSCLSAMDGHWNAINQQSMQLLVMSSEADPSDAARGQFAAICEGVVTACRDTRQSCAAFLAHALLERPVVST